MPRPRTGTSTLGPDTIVTAALQLMDERGEQELSLRNLAEELKVSPGAINYYFRSKDDIRRAAYLRVVSELTLPTDGTWTEQLERLVYDFRALCHRHRHVAPYLMEQHPPTPQEVRVYDYILTLMQEIGVPEDQLWHTTSHLIDTVLGFIYRELTGPGPANLAHQLAEFALNNAAAYPALAHAAQAGRVRADETFSTQLQFILNGITALTPRRKDATFR